MPKQMSSGPKEELGHERIIIGGADLHNETRICAYGLQRYQGGDVLGPETATTGGWFGTLTNILLIVTSAVLVCDRILIFSVGNKTAVFLPRTGSIYVTVSCLL